MYPFILLVGVVPWIMGVVYIIKLLNPNKIDNATLIKNLQQRMANLTKESDKKTFQDLINIIAGPYYSVPQYNSPPPTYDQPPPVHHENHPVPKPAHLEHKSLVNTLDNANILLYLGAFLVVVAASIFVGFNYQLLSDNSKLFFIFCFSLTFYISGLILYLKTNKLKPAGLTFNTIGMILAPLVGIAYWKFITLGENGQTVWFLTSLCTLLLYFVSVVAIKKAFVSYFLVFTALSLFESSINMFSFPTYYLFWGMAIFALIANYASRKMKDDYNIQESLKYTSEYSLPVALLCSIIAIISYGPLQAGVNLLIGFIFYAIFYLLEEDPKRKTIALALGIPLAYLGSSLIILEKTHNLSNIAWFIIFLSIIWSLLASTFPKDNDQEADITILYSGLGSFFALALVYTNHGVLLAVAMFSLVLNLANAVIRRNALGPIFALVDLLIIPAIYFGLISTKTSDNYMLVISYFVITCLMQYIILSLGKKTQIIANISRVGLAFSAFSALYIAFVGQNNGTMFGAFIFSGIFFLSLSFIDEPDIYSIIGISSLLLSIIGLKPLVHWGYANTTLVISGLGVLIYSLSTYFADNRKSIYQISGVLILVISVVYSFGSAGNDLLPIILLYILGGIVYHLGMDRNEQSVKHLAIAIAIAATESLMKYGHITENHLYMLPWSAYFGFLAYIQHTKNQPDNRNTLTVIALLFQTAPLLLQAQGYRHPETYGLILGLESIAIIIAGMLARYKLLTYWGAAALIIIVLNQLQDELLALPKWAVIGFIGIAFLVGAMYMLNKRQEHNS